MKVFIFILSLLLVYNTHAYNKELTCNLPFNDGSCPACTISIPPSCDIPCEEPSFKGFWYDARAGSCKEGLFGPHVNNNFFDSIENCALLCGGPMSLRPIHLNPCIEEFNDGKCPPCVKNGCKMACSYGMTRVGFFYDMNDNMCKQASFGPYTNLNFFDTLSRCESACIPGN